MRRGAVGGTRAAQRLDVIDAADAAAGAPRHRALAGEMRVQPLARERDPQLDPVVDGSLFDAANLLGTLDHPLGEAEAVGEVDEVGGGEHHHRKRHVGEGNLHRRLDGDLSHVIVADGAVEGDDAGGDDGWWGGSFESAHDRRGEYRIRKRKASDE